MSDTAILENGKHVDDLKVVELREELGKRGLSKSGNKKELADRLRGYLITGTGEVSEKSASSSPVKSPVNSLIAQYRSTQQQLLKDAQKEPEPSEEKKEEDLPQIKQVENGNKETNIQAESKVETVKSTTKQQSPVKEEEKEASPVKQEAIFEEEKESSPMEEDRQPSPPKKVSPAEKDKAASPEQNVPENEETSVQEQIPKAVSPIADRKRSKTPERELTPPLPTEEEEGDQKVVVSNESHKTDTVDRDISEEPADEEEERGSTSPRKNLQQVSGGESDNESRSPTPKSNSSDTKKQQQNLNGADKLSVDEDDEKMHSNLDGSKRKSEVYTEGIVYLKDEAVKRKPKTSVVSQNDEDLTSDGLVRRKSVSPPKQPPSNYVYIRGLRRPFTIQQFHAILEKFGTFSKEEGLWMDQLRSQSIIKFSTVEEASRCRDGLHHVKWPEFNGSELLVDFTDEEDFIQRKGVLRKVIKPESDVLAKENSLSPIHDDLPSPKEVIKRAASSVQDDDTDEGPSRKKKKETKSLEELFKRTTAQPSIYYLPLNDEEVARKLVQKSIEKRGAKEPSPETLPLPSIASSSSATTKQREKSPSPISPSPRRKSRSPQRKIDRASPRRRSPPRRSPPRRIRDSPPRRQRSPRRSSPPSKRRSSPPSKRRSPSPRRSPPSSRKPATTSNASPSGKKTKSSPPPQRRRSPSSPRKR